MNRPLTKRQRELVENLIKYGPELVYLHIWGWGAKKTPMHCYRHPKRRRKCKCGWDRPMAKDIFRWQVVWNLWDKGYLDVLNKTKPRWFQDWRFCLKYSGDNPNGVKFQF